MKYSMSIEFSHISLIGESSSTSKILRAPLAFSIYMKSALSGNHDKMASILRFQTNINELQHEIDRRNILAELLNREHFIAARKIQAWFRGIVTRKHLCKLHEQATIIQCHWRGYYIRSNFDKFLIKKVHEMWQNYYNCMATRIQAMWRGYWIRKTYLNLPERWQWLKNVYVKNEEIVDIMQKFKQNEINYAKSVMEHESLLWILFILFKSHHLLRTKVQAGVITRIDKTHFTVIEKMLKCLKYDLYKPNKQITCEHNTLKKQLQSFFSGTCFSRCEKEIHNFEEKLKDGIIPIYRSHSYDEEERLRNTINYLMKKHN